MKGGAKGRRMKIGLLTLLYIVTIRFRLILTVILLLTALFYISCPDADELLLEDLLDAFLNIWKATKVSWSEDDKN